MSIGSRIKERREQLGLTQVQLAELLGITKGAVGNYETDVNSPKASTLYKVFDVLHCDANYLFQDEMSEAPSLSWEENALLSSFRRLNEEGRERLLETADDMVQSGKYKKIGQSELGTKAASE